MRIFLTGGRGYVGNALAAEFASCGWEVVMPPSGWRMPESPGVGSFSGVDALVHAAWDMRPVGDAASKQTNVEGSRRLVEAAVAGGVRKLIFVSSMSAFEGCVSVYGRRKCDVERIFHELGGVAVRPGLVFGDSPGGMVGKLQGLGAKLPMIPLPCANAAQFLVHERDLAKYVAWAVEAADVPRVCSVAHSVPLTMRQIVRLLASRNGRNPLIVGIPWQIAYAGLKTAQMLGLPLPVTSDNLLGLARANPAPDFRPLSDSRIVIREFDPKLAR